AAFLESGEKIVRDERVVGGSRLGSRSAAELPPLLAGKGRHALDGAKDEAVPALPRPVVAFVVHGAPDMPQPARCKALTPRSPRRSSGRHGRRWPRASPRCAPSR